jgi:hypothetical protein
MKKLLTLIISLAIFGMANATDVGGNISSNTTWNLAGSPYVVTSSITVDAGVTLTIDTGVEVKFDNGRSMFVNGILNATSTTFTSNDASPTPGIWSYLQFYLGSVSTMSNCTIEYGRYIRVDIGANLSMYSNCLIENMYEYGIYNAGTVNINSATIDLAGYVTHGCGIYIPFSPAISVTNLSNVNIFNCERGIQINNDDSQTNFAFCSFSSNTWPVYLSGTGDISMTGTNDFTGNTKDAFYVFENTLNKNWYLPYINVPYYFRAGFTVNNTYTLSIDGDCILKFALYTGLEIKGKLQTGGFEGEHIYFTSERDDDWGGDTNNDGSATLPAVKDWYGIRFYDESDDASSVDRSKIRYAGYGNIGGITLYNASPAIQYSELQQNYYGVYIQYASNPSFFLTTIGTSSVTPVAMSFEANPTFFNTVISFTGNQYDAIGLIGGTLTADAQLIQRDFSIATNITYFMLAGITVPPGITLTIDPGIVIKSNTFSKRIQVQGKLVADGTSAEMITFTSVKDDNHGNPGDTNKDGTSTTPANNDISAIIFEDGHDPTSIVDHVRIKYAGVHTYYYSNGGSNHYVHDCAIATLSSVTPALAGPTITNCEIRESAFGISAYQSSTPIIFANDFINITNTPLSIASSANPAFNFNTYTNCGINALGLIGHNVVTDGLISKRDIAGYTNITYVLLEDITVKEGVKLDIDAGIVIKMYYRFWFIDGGFRMNGTSPEHVIFTSLYDDNVGNPMDTNGDGNATTPSKGNWYFIEFGDTSDDTYCVLDYAEIKYAGNINLGSLRIIEASPVVNNTLIDQSSGFGVRIDAFSSPSFNTVAIQNCSSDPIAISLNSDPTFSNITFTANFSKGIFILEGSLTSNATLVKRNIAGIANIAYIIDDLLIENGATLTLEEGIVIKFRGSYFEGIHVFGGLNAIGTSGQKIVFTSFKDDSAGGDTNNDGSTTIPTNGDWDGINFYPDSDDAANKLIYCDIKYGTNYFGFSNGYGVVEIKDAYVEIDNVVFQQGAQSALGIYGTANPDVTNCQFNNYNYTPVFMSMFSNPVFSGNSVANVKYTAIGIENETYSTTAVMPQRNFAGYANITYFLNGATINSGTIITIPAGTVFKSLNSTFTINGKLEVDGTGGNPVVFTDYRDDDYGNPMDTEQNGSTTTPSTYGPAFNFNDVSDDASYINYALIRYQNYPVNLSSASPTISNCAFYKNTIGIRNSGVCAPNITNNLFDDLTYAPIEVSLVSFPVVTSGNSLSGSTYKGIAVNSETLTQNVTLPKRSFAGIANAPYIFPSYTIGTGVTLSFDPGVICKFNSNATLIVNNGIVAEGLSTSGNRIIFTSITDDFYGGDTNADEEATANDYTLWYGIRISDVALDPLCRFDHCIFRNTNSSYGAIRTISSSPSILNSSFNNNYRGVRAEAASNPSINYCDFFDITYEAVQNVNQSFTIDATDCWWGSNSGPTHSGNPGGTGETVTDEVDYNPFGTSGAINPILGDASLNSIVQAYDASLILQHVVGSITLNPTQQGVSDVSGLSGITAYDASLVLQYVVGLINYFPAALLSPAPAPVSDVELTVGNAEVGFGEEFALPLSISNVSELYAMEMTISYDPDILEVIDIENLVPGMNANFSINGETGTVKIAFAGIEALEYALDAANIIFKVNEDVNTGLITPITAKYFMGNETDLTWNVTDGYVNINGFATGIGNDLENGYTQLSCYPNPFSNHLNIDYQITDDKQKVAIMVYDIYGKIVAEIANGAHDAATYKISWNGCDNYGIKLTNGTYFIRMVSQDKVVTQKIQIVR